MTLRTGQEALDWAAHESAHPSKVWTRLCLQFSRSAFNVASRYPTAENAFFNTTKRHTSWPPPAAVPIWWTNGRSGHVAVSAGGGKCWSTDFKRTGHVDLVNIEDITRAWNQVFQGWTEDINGVTVWTEPAPPRPVLDAEFIARAARKGEEAPNGVLLKEAVANEVGRGVMSVKSGKLGAGFRSRYKLVQKKYLQTQGVPKSDQGADGIPGRGSLTWLGKRQGFDVK